MELINTFAISGPRGDPIDLWDTAAAVD